MLKIHHIVLGNRVPPLVRECLNSWTTVTDCGFEFHQWTDPSIAEFMEHQPTEFKTLYKRAKNYGEAGDILRYMLLGSEGGLYVDWDVLLLDPRRLLSVLGDLNEEKCVFLEDRNTQAVGYKSVFASSLFYMRKGNPLTRDLLLQMDRDYVNSPKMPTAELTGPMALTRHLNTCSHYLREARIVNLTDVYSFDFAEVQKFRSKDSLMKHKNSSRAPAVHFWTNEWIDQKERSLRSVVAGVQRRVTSWLAR
jgi:mannosyltransferase OCH1-like enzyme